MSNINSKSPFALEPIEDRIDILFKELELAIKWQRPSILLAVYSSEYIHVDAATTLENQLIDIGVRVVHIDIKESDSLDIAALITAVNGVENTIFFVDGLRWAVQKDGTNIYRVLNTSRESFINSHIRVVFWLTENEAIDLARYAPDYWAYRHRVIEFIESPEPEQILLRSHTSAWQILGEDTDTIENTDEKIALRSGMLAELPETAEAMSIRSNLLLSLGILFWRKGALDTSLEHLNEALEIATKIGDPRIQAACFNSIAIVQTDLGLVNEAINSYQKTIALAPDQTFTWNNLGNLYEKLNRCEEAIDAFMKAIEQTPSDALAWNGLGNVYLKLHKNTDAIAAYNKSIEFDAALAYPWNGLGNAYASQGEFEAAVPAYQKSVELNKDFSIPWVNLGDIYQEQGNNQEALKAYWNAVRIDSKNAQIWNSLGNAYMSAGLCEEAIKSYNKAIKLSRNYEAAYTNLAAAYSLVGNYADSVAYYQKSVELLSGQKQPSAYSQIEQTYRQFVLVDQDEPEADEADDEAVVIEDPVDVQIKTMMQEIDPVFESELEDESELEETDGIDDEEDPDELPGSEAADNDETTEQVEQTVVELPGFLTDELLRASQAEPSVAEEMSTPDAFVTTNASENDANTGISFWQSNEPKTAAGAILQEPQAAAKVDVDEETPAEEVAASAEVDLPREVEPVVVFDELPEPALSAQAESMAIEIVFQDIEQLIEVDLHGSEADHSGPEFDATFTPESAFPVDEASDELPNPTVESQAENEALSEVAQPGEAEPVSETRPFAEDTSPTTLESRIERMPKDAFVWNELGNIYFNISEYEDAVAAYKQAIELDPCLGWSYNNLALAYSLQSRYEEALQVYGKIIYLLTTPDEKISWRGPGNLHVNYNEMGSLRQLADSLLAQIEPAGASTREILVADIYSNPDQPRIETETGDLANTMQEQSLLEPLIVAPNGQPGKFMLISGMRRLEAARKAGLQTVPVIIREVDDREKMEFVLVENARRVDLNPLELAEAYHQLIEEFHLSHEEIAARVGRSRGEIANTLGLLKLSEKVKQALFDRLISEGHAIALLALSTPLAQDILLKNILDKKLSVLQTEELVRNSVGRKPSFLFAEDGYDETDPSEYGESALVASRARRKEVRSGDFSLISRARSVLRSNYQPADIADSSSHHHLAQGGGVHG
jgi:ParB family chromosome partitioning protein